MAIYKVKLLVTHAGGRRETIVVTDDRPEWDMLDPVKVPRRGVGNSTTLTLPERHFHYSARVHDVQVGLDGVTISEARYVGTLAGCVLLIVESPHKSEYDDSDGGFRPLEPLFDARENLAAHMPRLLEQCGREYLEMPVVICNPVQFQASLASLMRKTRAGMERPIRNKIWRALFSSDEIRNSFLCRVAGYDPSLILIATTGRLKSPVRNALSAYPASVVREVIHPSWWGVQIPDIRPRRRLANRSRPNT